MMSCGQLAPRGKGNDSVHQVHDFWVENFRRRANITCGLIQISLASAVRIRINTRLCSLLICRGREHRVSSIVVTIMNQAFDTQ